MAQNQERPLRLVGDARVNAVQSDRAQRASSAESARKAVIMRVRMSSDEGLLPDDAA
jgi:hypothetical protein